MDKFNFINNIVCETKAYKELSYCIDNSVSPIFLSGVPMINKADIIRAVCTKKNKKSFVILSDELQAVKFAKDLTMMGMKAYPYYSKDFNFIDAIGQSKEYEYKRLSVLHHIINDDFDVIVTSVDSALQYTIPPNILKKEAFLLSVNDEITIKDLIKKLLFLNYESFEQVESFGQFSVRGGIVDIFSPSNEQPVRIEFWGNNIDTISFFDPETQRRNSTVKYTSIIPCSEVIVSHKDNLATKINDFCNSSDFNTPERKKAKDILISQVKLIQDDLPVCLDKFISFIYSSPATLFDYFSRENHLLFEFEPANIAEKISSSSWQISQDKDTFFKNGILLKGLDCFSKDDYYYESIKDISNVIYMDTFSRSAFSGNIKKHISASAISYFPWNGSLQLLYDNLNDTFTSKSRLVILAGTEKYAKNLAKTLQDENFNAIYSDSSNKLTKGIILVIPGTLSAGFSYPECDFQLITFVHDTSNKKKQKKNKDTQSISTLSDLKDGDLVVHISHGIGIFCGIHKINANGTEKDYIKIKYAKNDILYIPVTQLDMVSKYIGTKEDAHIKLNSLSGSEWEKTKTRARAAAKDIAKQLIKLYSKRMNTKGYAFSADNPLQRDFEAGFEFEETDDQLKCINEIKDDMEKIVPMDRLLCGDVGFGKTEVALRAIFKCISDSKQCAFLVPTTILAWQHYQTMLKRFEKFPVNIELLSRFRTKKEKEETIKNIKLGKTDIVIGTHRLVQKDIEFKNLGLAVIDEEQRFGVEQKEKFKQLKSNVDILTLSATPIPRTLNMAMSGLRDMSSIEEAPQDRHPVQTYVLEHDSRIIIDAIKKELRRGGQVYYLHNRTFSIEQTALALQNAIPDYTVTFAHGKMSEKELSRVWREMIEHEIDVLVCTTIIETGIDVPNVNTIIIDNADHMGLSQLHQLRGRVGRSSRRAYAYFTFFPNKVLSEVSEKRLNAIQEFTQFGSGFRIAMRDLEIRGAGNILGAEQHGHMESIGYDLYMKILNEAIKFEKGEQSVDQYDFECLVDLPVSAFIPDNYIRDLNQRLDIYKKISLIRSSEDVTDIVDELIDRFGEPPSCVIGLIDIALIRASAQKHRIHEIKYKNSSIFLYQKNVDMEFASNLINQMKGKVLVNAASKPYICIKTENQQNILSLLKNILKE